MKRLIGWLLFPLSFSCLFTFSASAKNQQLPVAPAPVEVALEGLRDPAFLAIDAHDVLYLSEEQAGRCSSSFLMAAFSPLLKISKNLKGLLSMTTGPFTSPPKS